MTRKELDMLEKVIDVDWIEDNVIDAYDIITKLIQDNRHLLDRVEMSEEGLKFAVALNKELNKENKKLHKNIK